MGKPRKNRGTGKGLVFLRAALATDCDDCIDWPYYRMKNGYGQVGRYDGGMLAHRHQCMEAHGAPPSSGHQAIHSCGNRACVNPRHLRWGTQKDNEDDKLSHGTWFARISGAKLTVDKVLAIRADTQLSLDQLEIKYGTPRSTLQKVLHRWTWRHV
jgi:HNH endonuclease